MLRPSQLREELERCPLVFLPVGPLEYHGPHMPLGTDPLNAQFCAVEACRRLGKGVVMPTLYMGTERERPAWMLESLGFKKDDWVVGMDFPTALWKSHYYQEHLFGLVVASTVEMLISQGYKVVVIVNGHGAWNQLETLDRIAKHYSHETDAAVVWKLAFTLDLSEKNLAGHADLFETSLLLNYEREEFLGAEGRGPRRAPAPQRAHSLHRLLHRGRGGLQRSSQPGPGRPERSPGRHRGEGAEDLRRNRGDVRGCGCKGPGTERALG